jgi:hypothetical protein
MPGASELANDRLESASLPNDLVPNVVRPQNSGHSKTQDIAGNHIDALCREESWLVHCLMIPTIRNGIMI